MLAITTPWMDQSGGRTQILGSKASESDTFQQSKTQFLPTTPAYGGPFWGLSHRISSRFLCHKISVIGYHKALFS